MPQNCVYASSTGPQKAHVIEHNGVLWIVRTWAYTTATKVYTPTRMLRLDSMAHRVLPGNSGPVYVVEGPKSKWIEADGPIPASEGIEAYPNPEEVAFQSLP